MNITPNLPNLTAAAARKRLRLLQQESTAVAKQTPATSLKVSALGKHFGKALTMLDEQEKVRPDAVARAKQAMHDWKQLSGDQLDRIVDSLLQDV